MLVVATSRKTRGGITSVVRSLEGSVLWKKYHCHWVQTHRDGNVLRKIWYMVRGLIDFAVRLPFYDIVHIHVATTSSLRRKMFYAKLAKKAGKRIVVHFHACNTSNSISGLMEKSYGELFELSDCVIALSNWWKIQIANTFPTLSTPVRIVYNPCEPKETINSERKKTILYAGSIIPRKGYADLIRAFAKISGQASEWTLQIAGNGEVDKGKELAKESGIADKVEFLGWIEGENKEKAFKEASIFCLPSYEEGFPMAVLDAWSYGLPVVTTPVGGIPDVAEDGKNMLLFPPGDVDTLASQMLILIKDESLRCILGQESASMARGIFSIEETCRKLGDIFKNCL